MAILGVLTIGQAPRGDLTPELERHLPAGSVLIERGALDRLARAEIAALAPVRDSHALTTRLRDATSVVIDRDLLIPYLEDAIDVLEDNGADATLLVCTGTFPPLRHRRPHLDAEHLLVHGIAGLAESASEPGIIVPLAGQREVMSERWRAALGRRVLADAADPYGHQPERLVAAAAVRLARRGADLLVLDCMGFSESTRRAAAENSGLPVILARSLVGRLASEQLCSLPAK